MDILREDCLKTINDSGVFLNENAAEIILVFASNTEVLNAEDCLEEADLPFELVPVPKEVNPNCGLAISFAPTDESNIMAALAEGGLTPQAAYLRRGGEFSSFVTDGGAN